ncbi:small glutamine-rich tetratricopeptide repeat-containing protein 2 isoform X2 [Malania oleifera]|uniref:small glutamine-rich tetratricopeptide repeat-containing protein 2 isoform X2 n=1 Tax=Malania oleifera TaxID=397392 RepID=UPI0025AE9404|nr:small glutamine-rich tetratricopeptide repeat-containing protein 2 isoform X2 [Malania oleifera]
MANLCTDSPLSRRIVHAFLTFLDSVKPAPGVDLEGLEVARECLTEVFKLEPSSVDDRADADLLVNMFSSLEGSRQSEIRSDISHTGVSVDAPSTSSPKNAVDSDYLKAVDWTRQPCASGIAEDELFGQFFAALEKIHFFEATLDGNDDQVQLDRATRIFHDAKAEMEKAGCQNFDRNNLAEMLKSQGNRAMQLKLYPDAIELYSCAVALCENNAVYYCNRAAAYTQIHRYTEAIRDCQKSIEIDPNYSKAYSRLGFAYYAEGNYTDAISKGFLKALQLDPNNDAVKENIRVAEQKLREELQWTERNQNSGSGSHHNQDSGNQSAGRSRTPPSAFSTSMQFDAGALPPDIASMFMNMAANAYQGQGQHSQDRPEDGNNASGFEEPGIRIGGNVSLNFGEQMPEELTGALRSMMGMFSGAAPHGSPQGGMNGRSEPN